MRFVLDENVSVLLVARLESLGHDVIHIAASYPSMSDPDILGLANAEGRVIITHDLWFADFPEHHGRTQPGTIILRPKALTPEQAIEKIVAAIVHEGEALIGRLTIIDRNRVRTVDFG